MSDLSSLSITGEEGGRRIERVRLWLRENGYGALAAFSGPRANIWYQTGHVGYLSNWSNRDRSVDSMVVVPREGDPVLLIAGCEAHRDWARKVSWIDDIRLVAASHAGAVAASFSQEEASSNTFGAATRRTLGECGPGGGPVAVLGADHMPVPVHRDIKAALGDDMDENAEDIIADMRSVKSPAEVRLHRRAAELADLGYETLLRIAKPSMWGYQLAAELERAIRFEGADYAQFFLASGPAEAIEEGIMDARPHDRKLERGDQIVAGAYVVYDGYWAQSIRCGALGRPSRQQRKMFDAADAAFETCLETMAPGVGAAEVAARGRSVCEAHGYTIHGGRIGHGQGLDYSEQPFFSEASEMSLETGNVAVVHPALDDPGTGALVIPLGELCLLGPGGVEVLTHFPREPFGM